MEISQFCSEYSSREELTRMNDISRFKHFILASETFDEANNILSLHRSKLNVTEYLTILKAINTNEWVL